MNYNDRISENEYKFSSGMRLIRQFQIREMLGPNYLHGSSSYSYIDIGYNSSWASKFINVRSSIEYSMLPVEYEKYQELMGAGHIGSVHIVDSYLENFKGIPRTIDGNLEIYEGIHYLMSLQDIHKNFLKGSITGQLVIPATVQSNILGTILINGLKRVHCPFNELAQNNLLYNQEYYLNKALTIVNNNLQKGRDVLECQEQLITAELRHFAKL
jgi:hypothetical protein